MPNKSQTVDYEPVTNSRRKPLRENEVSVGDWRARTRDSSNDPDSKKDGEIRAGAKHLPSSQKLPSSSKSPSLISSLLRRESWIVKRGHAISFVGLLMFTLILYVRPQEYFPSLVALRIALAAALLAAVAFVPSQLATEGTLTARPREVNLILLLCLTALLSIPLAISPVDSLNYFWDPFFKAVIVFILIVNVVRTEGRLRVLLYVMLAVTCLLCLQALSDYRSGFLAVEGYRVAGRSTGGMFENPNDLATHLVTMLPLAIVLALSTRNALKKTLFGACAVFIAVGIVITFSRGAFLGLMAMGSVMAWKLGRHNRLIVFAAVFFVAALFFMLAPGEYWNRIASMFDSSLDRYGSSDARSELLKRSFIVSLANPLFGVGIGNFSLLSQRAQVTHNSYTQVSAEIGFAAAVIYTMFIVAPLKRLRLMERETRDARRASSFYYLSVGLQASLVGYMVSSAFASVAFYLYIYYLVGYAVCLRRIYIVSEENKDAKRKSSLR